MEIKGIQAINQKFYIQYYGTFFSQHWYKVHLFNGTTHTVSVEGDLTEEAAMKKILSVFQRRYQ